MKSPAFDVLPDQDRLARKHGVGWGAKTPAPVLVSLENKVDFWKLQCYPLLLLLFTFT